MDDTTNIRSRETEDGDDTEGHAKPRESAIPREGVLRRESLRPRETGDEDDTEGHFKTLRSPSSRGE